MGADLKAKQIVNQENGNGIDGMDSSIYQTAYTLALVLLSFISIAFMISAAKDKEFLRAFGNGLISIFCVFGCLVRFGLIAN